MPIRGTPVCDPARSVMRPGRALLKGEGTRLDHRIDQGFAGASALQVLVEAPEPEIEVSHFLAHVHPAQKRVCCALIALPSIVTSPSCVSLPMLCVCAKMTDQAAVETAQSVSRRRAISAALARIHAKRSRVAMRTASTLSRSSSKGRIGFTPGVLARMERLRPAVSTWYGVPVSSALAGVFSTPPRFHQSIATTSTNSRSLRP